MNNDLLDRMKTTIVERLKETGDFLRVTPSPQQHLLLRAKERKRIILMQKLRERYVIYCHDNSYPNNTALFEEDTKIPTTHILAIGDNFFQKDKEYLTQFREGDTRNLVRTKDLERLLMKKEGKVLYYDPEGENIHVVRLFQDVIGRYDPTIPGPRRKLLKTVMRYELIDVWNRFTMDKNGLRSLSLDEEIGVLLRREEKSDEYERYNSGERMGIILDSCSFEDRLRLTKKYGENALGDYAVSAF